MSGWIGKSADELITKKSEVFQSIEQEMPISVYEKWIKSLKWMTENDGEYYHK
jgi:hypothetical protein